MTKNADKIPVSAYVINNFTLVDASVKEYGDIAVSINEDLVFEIEQSGEYLYFTRDVMALFLTRMVEFTKETNVVCKLKEENETTNN